MSKTTVDKAHIQQSLASKIWQQVKRHFQKPTDESNITISDDSMKILQRDLALVKENDVAVPASRKEYHEEFEVEITLDELQDALTLLEKQNAQLLSADDAIKQLIDTLKKSEKKSKVVVQHTAQKNEVEVIVELIPLATPHPIQHNTPIYREILSDKTSDNIKKEKEQRELSKKITHYPPSDRLH